MGESGQKVQTPSYKINKSRGYHGLTVTIINNTLSYLKAAKSKKILITRKSICNCIQWQMLIQIIMVSISQYIRETQVQSLSREDPLEKEMATHSNVFVWRIPWTKETVTPWAIVYGFSPWGHKELNTTEWLTLYWPYKQLLGAGVRHSAHGKGHEEGGSTYAKVGSSLRSPPVKSKS